MFWGFRFTKYIQALIMSKTCYTALENEKIYWNNDIDMTHVFGLRILNFHFFYTGVVWNESPGLVEQFVSPDHFTYDLSKCFKFSIEIRNSPSFLKKSWKNNYFLFEVGTNNLIWRKIRILLVHRCIHAAILAIPATPATFQKNFSWDF